MKSKINFRIFICCFALCVMRFAFAYSAQEVKEGPIIVNGDKVEFLTDSKEVSAEGNVSVEYKGAKLTCDKLSVNTQTKDATAEGHVRLQDAEHGIIEAPKMVYNFDTKTGTMIEAGFKANPYFGRAEKIEKVSDKEFVAYNGYASTCNYDHPHYRLQAKEVRMFPGDKIQTKGDAMYLGKLPIFYLPYYNHSLKDPMMHVRVSPGQRKDWGGYVLSAWRYNLTQYIDGRVYLDYRQKLGFAEGFGANYNTRKFGKGDFKFYFAEERPETRSIGEPKQFNRYLARLRHRWDINQRTYLLAQYYKIYDEKMKYNPSVDGLLKEYFYREYEKDSQPLSYILLQHYFNYASLNFTYQKRTNHWFDYLEMLPQIQYTLPAYKMGPTPFYFENETAFANFNQQAAVSGGSDTKVTRFDTINKISLPFRLMGVSLNPFVAERGTYYNTDNFGRDNLMRAIFYTGAEASVKFYKVLDVKNNLWGLNINGLRHIFTPSVKYKYNHEPTINMSGLKQIDEIDTISAGNSLSIELSNKLQTKRGGQSVDLVDFLVTTDYLLNNLDPVDNLRVRNTFSDIYLQLKFLPYSWLRFDLDATYKRSGLRSNPTYNHFSSVNYDINFDFGKERNLGIGQRYDRLGANEITTGFNWRINPKWKFSIYERYNTSGAPNVSRGLREQEYGISRDFHCWIIDARYNISEKDGHTVWFIFRLKAFPETEFGFDQNYNKPNSGSSK